MKRIAILACQRANDVCAGCACLNAFYDRRASFAQYAREELRLTAFMRCSHCISERSPLTDPGFLEKLDRLIDEGVECVHIGICAKQSDGGVCPGMKAMADCFEERGVHVVWGTH